MVKIAIIGAGISGLALANTIKKNIDVVLFEKSRGFGGRVATRRANDFSFDHGAQFFKAKTLEFQNYIQPMLDQNIIELWKARFIEIIDGEITNKRTWGNDPTNYVGAPSMNSIGKYMAEGLNVQLSKKVEKISKEDKWVVYDENNDALGEYDWIISSIPPLQAQQMIPDLKVIFPNIREYEMLACFSLMLGYEQPVELDFDAALVKGFDISWISVNSSKPSRDKQYTLLVHSTNKWAQENIDKERDWVKDYLCYELKKIISIKTEKAKYIGLQGWRYANIMKQKKGLEYFLNNENQIGLCGDWFIQGRIEAAYLSGAHLGKELLSYIG
jgi:renalase